MTDSDSASDRAPDLRFRDRAVYVEPAETLVIADTHVGRDEASGVAFPLGERSDLRERLADLVAYFDPQTVVFAGDLVHTFDRVTDASQHDVRALLDVCRGRNAEPVLVAGNHDTAFESWWDGPIHEAYLLDGDESTRRTAVCHGHELPAIDADRYVCGHDHPTIEIEGMRHPCFLYGPGPADAEVLMLPAFNRLAPGAVVNNRREFESPLAPNPDALRPIVYDPDTQETLWFPPLGRFRDRL